MGSQRKGPGLGFGIWGGLGWGRRGTRGRGERWDSVRKGTEAGREFALRGRGIALRSSEQTHRGLDFVAW